MSNTHESPIAVAEASRRALTLARRVAASDCHVLITGEFGVGKERLARFVHADSSRGEAGFVRVSGIGCTEQALEDGFASAAGGTLYIDEVSELDFAVQGRFVRLLQTVGGQGGRRVRVVASAHRRILDRVRSGDFREDLYYRLNEFPLQVAPLRERIEDILPLAVQILGALTIGGETPALSSGAVEMLRAHAWPGNIRELSNVLRRAVILSQGILIDEESIEFDGPASTTTHRLADGAGSVAPSSSIEHSHHDGEHSSITIDGRSAFARQRDQAERAILLAALRDGRGTRTDIAQRLGISPRTLRYKLARMRAAGMEVPA